jgi:hypothetical protein
MVFERKRSGKRSSGGPLSLLAPPSFVFTAGLVTVLFKHLLEKSVGEAHRYNKQREAKYGREEFH